MAANLPTHQYCTCNWNLRRWFWQGHCDFYYDLHSFVIMPYHIWLTLVFINEPQPPGMLYRISRSTNSSAAFGL